MTSPKQNAGFTCMQCAASVQPLTNGSYRNHCPYCLYSLHLDNVPGDRLSPCKGLMRPLRLVHKSGKGWQIVHVCMTCGIMKPCRIATDTLQPDDHEMLMRLLI